MQVHAVVETDDVLGDFTRGLGVVAVVALPDSLHFQVQEETHHHGFVPAIAISAHACAQAMAFEQAAVDFAGVLAAAARMRDQAR